MSLSKRSVDPAHRGRPAKGREAKGDVLQLALEKSYLISANYRICDTYYKEEQHVR